MARTAWIFFTQGGAEWCALKLGQMEVLLAKDFEGSGWISTEGLRDLAEGNNPMLSTC